jgi:hypothetical protein
MSTDTWSDDIEEIARAVVTGELEQLGEVVTESELHQQVEDALNSMDVPTRDEVLSPDDVNDAIYDYLTAGNIDITDLVDIDQLLDTYPAQDAIRGFAREAVSECEAITDLEQRVNDLTEQVGTEEPNGLADQIKSLTERVEYLEQAINTLVDHFDSLGKALNPPAHPTAFNPPAAPVFIAEESPYAAI